MHRIPKPQDQARLLEKAFLATGQVLAHRQALDLVARLHGHASWHVMSEARTAPPSDAEVLLDVVQSLGDLFTRRPDMRSAFREELLKMTTPPATAAPLVPPEDSADALRVYAFEAMGFVSRRTVLDRLSGPSARELFEEKREALAALGFTDLMRIDLSEDDGQSNRDIKVFVTVRLQGRRGLRALLSQQEHVLAPLLEHLAQSVCCNAAGEDKVGPENWELVDVD